MTVDTSINRDLKLLRRIREKLGVELKLMVNEGCLQQMPLIRKFHMNLISHKIPRRARRGQRLPLSLAATSSAAKCRADFQIELDQARRYAPLRGHHKLLQNCRPRSECRAKCFAAPKPTWTSPTTATSSICCAAPSAITASNSARTSTTRHLAGRISSTRTSTCNRQCQRCAYCAELADELLGYGLITREMLEDMGRRR